MASEQAKTEFKSYIFQFILCHTAAVQELTLWDSMITIIKSGGWYVMWGIELVVAGQFIWNVAYEWKIGESNP